MNILDRLKSVKDKRVPRKLQVKSATNLTPNMRRVTLHGDALNSFPQKSEGAYIKLLFDQADQAKPVMRTYTVAQQRSDENEIDVDFMLHSNDDKTNATLQGIAAPWSENAKMGDEITLLGPGPAKFINLDAEYFFLAADMTALPALIANLKTLPDDAKGKVFIEILAEADKQIIKKPENVEINWVINDSPGSDEAPLFQAIYESDWLGEKTAIWVACEFKTMKKIRQYLKEDRSVDKQLLYVSSYWKKGDNEEQHKVAKKADSEGS